MINKKIPNGYKQFGKRLQAGISHIGKRLHSVYTKNGGMEGLIGLTKNIGNTLEKLAPAVGSVNPIAGIASNVLSMGVKHLTKMNTPKQIDGGFKF
jgi:hypothetical protein